MDRTVFIMELIHNQKKDCSWINFTLEIGKERVVVENGEDGHVFKISRISFDMLSETFIEQLIKSMF